METTLYELEAAIVDAHRNAVSHRVAMLFALAEFDRLRLYERAGFESAAKWLCWRLEIAPETAREHVRVARSLLAFPEIAVALRSGSVSFARVRAITRAATVQTQKEWLALAERMNAPELERHIRDVRAGELRENPSLQSSQRFLRTRIGADGMLHVEGRAPTVEGAIIDKALRVAGKRLNVSTETDPLLRGSTAPNRRRLDALAAICRDWLAGRHEQRRGEEFRILVHFDAATGTARIGEGPVLSRATLVRLLRSARIGVSVATPDGDVRAAHVTLPPRLRREILARDRTCRYPGCSSDVHIDIHHRIHRRDGGTDAHANLAAFCTYHHRFVHRSKARIEPDEDGRIAVRLPDGRVIAENAGDGAVRGERRLPMRA